MDPRYQDFGTENELATILSHYNSNFVYDIVNEHIGKIKSGAVNMIATPPNVVAAWEQNFKAIMDQYGAEGASKIKEVREATYREIIDIICNSYNLSFTISDNLDIYSAAYALYDFFVCNISTYITRFYSTFIYKERVAIYEGMGLSDLKKNKDSSTIYGKRMYKDIKMAVITANINKVIANINGGMEFDFITFVSLTIADRNLSRYLLSLVADRGNFFNDSVVPIFNGNMAEYITNIRFAIQENAAAHDMIIYHNSNETNNMATEE